MRRLKTHVSSQNGWIWNLFCRWVIWRADFQSELRVELQKLWCLKVFVFFKLCFMNLVTFLFSVAIWIIHLGSLLSCIVCEGELIILSFSIILQNEELSLSLRPNKTCSTLVAYQTSKTFLLPPPPGTW